MRPIGLPAATQGEAITPGGHYRLAAMGSGAAVIRVARAGQGRAGAVLGSRTSPGGAGAVEVTLSGNGAFARASNALLAFSAARRAPALAPPSSPACGSARRRSG